MYKGQTSKKWYSFSTTFRLQNLHNLSLLGVSSYRPLSIAKSCDDSLNREKAVLIFLFEIKSNRFPG